jgi:hypothetical protein
VEAAELLANWLLKTVELKTPPACWAEFPTTIQPASVLYDAAPPPFQAEFSKRVLFVNAHEYAPPP